MTPLTVHVGFTEDNGVLIPESPVILGYSFVLKSSDWNHYNVVSVDDGPKIQLPIGLKWWILSSDGFEAGYVPTGIAETAKLMINRHLFATKNKYVESRAALHGGVPVPLLLDYEYTEVRPCDASAIHVGPDGVSAIWTPAMRRKLFICSSVGYMFTPEPRPEDAGLFQIIDEEVIY